MCPVIRSSELHDHEFQGADHGSGLSVIFVDTAPGRGPELHRHAYEEVFIVGAGQATFTLATTQLEALPGDVVIVPAGTPHAFVNSGDAPLRMTAIHHAPAFLTEWLEGPQAAGSGEER
jgi:mannose-6-phosphate isomerase-like protein (cupin superfamily)